jgi:tetratricopeptide (TPR) repeat protein
MKLLFTGVAVALAVSPSVATAQAYGAPTTSSQPAAQAQAATSADAGIKPSPQAAKAILELQTAVEAKDANIPAKLAAAQAAAKTKGDHYWIARLQLKAALESNNFGAAATAMDAIAATGVLPQSALVPLYSGLGGTEYNAKQYDAAAASFEHLLAIDPNNTEAMVGLARSRAGAGRGAEAVSTLQRAIQTRTAAGAKPDEQLLKEAMVIAYDAKLPSAVQLSREWVSDYPSPQAWHDAIAIHRNIAHQDSESTLDLLRLMQAAGAMNSAGDYALFAQADEDQRNYVEAQAVVDAGIAAKAIDPSDSQLKGLVADVRARQKPTAADLDAALKMSPAPMNLLRIGDDYYALGNYSKAAEIYRQTMGKAGIDADVANLHLGMALARGGDKAGATAAFQAVTGPRADIAKLWLTYLQQHG